WTPQNSGTTDFLASVAFGNGQFVVTRAGPNSTTAISVSTNGSSWTEANPRTIPPSALDILPGLDFAEDVFLAVGRFSAIWSSINGLDWTLRQCGTGARLNGITFGANQFVAVGNVGEILTSPDGLRWSERTSGFQGGLGGICFSRELFVA